MSINIFLFSAVDKDVIAEKKYTNINNNIHKLTFECLNLKSLSNTAFKNNDPSDSSTKSNTAIVGKNGVSATIR